MASPLVGTEASHARPTREPTVVRGVCHALFAYDLGLGIDLTEAERLSTDETQRETIRYKRRAPHTVIAQPAPLRITQALPPIQVGPFRTEPTVDAVLYDFGAVSVTFTIPMQGTLDALDQLSDALYENEQLMSESRRVVERVLHAIRGAVTRPTTADLVEDYAIFQIEAFEPACDAPRLLDQCADRIGRILRSSRTPLSVEETADALACRISYEPADLALIDWNATLLVGTDPEDVRTVLEYANVELLEMRVLDRQLDDALEASYWLLSRRHRPGWGLFGSRAADLQRIGRLQVDSAILFEGVTNALKLVGDQYLARVYRLASQRFHLAEWDAGIIRKLQTLESIYSKLSDRQMNLRIEVLEWIIILLIAFEIVLTLVQR